MTREEAIKSALKFLVRKQQEQGSWGYADNDDTHEVSWDEIIRWVDQRSCGDLISRQAVLKILNKVIIRYDELKPKYELIIIKSAMEKMADEIVKDLEKLPSVEPERSECPWYGNDGKCHFAEGEIDEPERKKGKWIEKAEDYYKAINEYGGGVDENTDYFTDDIACPKCLSKFSVIDNETERFDFCPACGADMREVQDDNC